MYVCIKYIYVIYDFVLKTIWALCPTQGWALCPIGDTSKYFELSAVFILAHPNQLQEHAAHTTYFRHIFCICLNVLPFSRSTRISMVVFFIIIRAEKVNAYYSYIGQIKTSSSVDRSFVCCSESFDRHMEPHNSRFAKIRGARFAPSMGAMPHPTL